MSRLRAAFAAYLVVAVVLAPVALAGPGTGSAGAADSLASNWTEVDDATERPICLIEKRDLTLTDPTLEVRRQEGTPFETRNLSTSPRLPDREDGEPLIFENDRTETDRLCATLSFEYAPIKVILEDVTLHNQSIVGRQIEQRFEAGRSDRLVLYVTLESALDLLPEIISAAADGDSSRTSAWNDTWDGATTAVTAGNESPSSTAAVDFPASSTSGDERLTGPSERPDRGRTVGVLSR
jgi:hypothetical protein